MKESCRFHLLLIRMMCRSTRLPCWLTYTNEKTHEIIRDNLDSSPAVFRNDRGNGPRYCPSIEDKVVKFADKNVIRYLLSRKELIQMKCTSAVCPVLCRRMSSMPCTAFVPGLEHAKIVRNAYAIEYDCIDARQLNPHWNSERSRDFQRRTVQRKFRI